MSFYENQHVKNVRFELETFRKGIVKEYVIIKTNLSLDPGNPDFDKSKCCTRTHDLIQFES